MLLRITYILLACCSVVMKHITAADDPIVAQGKVLGEQRKPCVMSCKLPDFLTNICEPVNAYLKCGKKLQDDINNFNSMGEISSACSCLWHDVFKKARVDKLLFMEIVDFKAVDKKEAVRTRVSTLARLCRGFNDQLCGEFISGYKPNKTALGHGKIFSSKEGWNMAPARKEHLINLTKTLTTTPEPIGNSSGSHIVAIQLTTPKPVIEPTSPEPSIKLTSLKPTPANPSPVTPTTATPTVKITTSKPHTTTDTTVNPPQTSPGMLKGKNLFGLQQSEQVILGIVVASVAVVLIVCMFFILKLKREIQPGFGDGSLLYNPNVPHSPHGRNSTSYDKFMDKLRTSSRTTAAERERLLDHEDNRGMHNNALCRSNKKTEKKKKSKHSLGPSMTCQGTQCDTVDFDVSMTSFSVSEENIQAKTMTGMPISDSESDGDESRVFHSSLMYGKRDQQERLGKNTFGPSSTSLISN